MTNTVEVPAGTESIVFFMEGSAEPIITDPSGVPYVEDKEYESDPLPEPYVMAWCRPPCRRSASGRCYCPRK